jgi:hypothetical protein
MVVHAATAPPKRGCERERVRGAGGGASFIVSFVKFSRGKKFLRMTVK